MPRAPMLAAGKPEVPLLAKPAAAPTNLRAAPVLTPAMPASPSKAASDAEIAQVIGGAVDFVLFDQPQADGPLWVSTPSWKASFDHQGWSFVPFLGSEAPQNYPVSFGVPQVQLGGEPLPAVVAVPTRNAQRVEYDHGSFVEALDVHADGIEQSFRFDRLPNRGELVLTIATHSDLHGEDRGDGLAFTNQLGGVTYGEAVAFDANGARVAAQTSLANGTITIRVPGPFVAAAKLPLTIDPLVQSLALVSGSAIVGNTDVAWDDSSSGIAICYQRVFSAADTDCYVVRASAEIVFQSIFSIDVTTVSWTSPKIASNNDSNIFLVVCQVSANNQAPYWIGGRTLTNIGLTGGQFDIERAGVAGHHAGSNFRPDVGGDPYLASPSYFTVVWEHEYSPTDHDIFIKQVTTAGTLRSASPTSIDNSTAFQSNPTISKSDGPGTSNLQRWAIVYQQTYSATDEDLYGALVTWDGQLVPVGGNIRQDIDRSAANTVWPRVSSPSAGQSRTFMVVSEVEFTYGGIRLQVTDSNLGWLWTNDIVTLENDPLRAGWAKRSPCVDCDGVRFTVAYQEAYNNTTDWDVRGSLVAFDLNQFLFTQEVGTGFSGSADIDLFPEVASRYSGSAILSDRYAISCQRSSPLSGTFEIVGAAYAGHAPGAGISLRPTGCGTLVIGWTGVPLLGQRVDFTLFNAQALTGFVFGLPGNTPLGICPGCTVGVNGSSLFGSTLAVDIPPAPSFVGVTVSVQGFTFGIGPCLGQISLSDTADVQIR